MEKPAPNADRLGSSPVQKELRDKLAWSVGTTLHLPYGRKTPVMIWADRESSRLCSKSSSPSSRPEPNNASLIEGNSQAQTYAEWAKENPLITG